MSDNLSNYLQHLEPSALSVVLSHLDDKEATDTLRVIVGLRDEEKRAHRRRMKLAANPPQK